MDNSKLTKKNYSVGGIHTGTSKVNMKYRHTATRTKEVT